MCEEDDCDCRECDKCCDECCDGDNCKCCDELCDECGNCCEEGCKCCGQCCDEGCTGCAECCEEGCTGCGKCTEECCSGCGQCCEECSKGCDENCCGDTNNCDNCCNECCAGCGNGIKECTSCFTTCSRECREMCIESFSDCQCANLQDYNLKYVSVVLFMITTSIVMPIIFRDLILKSIVSVIVMGALAVIGLLNYLIFNRNKTRPIIYVDFLNIVSSLIFQQYLVWYHVNIIIILICYISNVLGVLLFFSFGFILREYKFFPIKYYWYYEVSSSISDIGQMVVMFLLESNNIQIPFIVLTINFGCSLIDIIMHLYDAGRSSFSNETMPKQINNNNIVNENNYNVNNNQNDRIVEEDEIHSYRYEKKTNNYIGRAKNAAAEVSD